MPGTIPTQTANEVITKLKQYAPLLSEVTLLQVAGNVTYAVEGANADAALHTQNAAITPAADTTVAVVLGGYEIVKLIRISQTVSTMAINAFETWLVEQLSESVAIRIEAFLVNGTGTNQPQGVAAAATWGAGNSVTVGAAAALTSANVMDMISLLKGG